MYSVHTQPRQGRPRWATAASATLLLITVALAQGLIHLKGRGHHVPLEQPQFLDRGQLTCALPTGWERLEGQEQVSGVVVAVREPSRDNQPGRQVWILRAAPEAMGVPSREARLMAEQALRRLARGVSKTEDDRPTTLGAFPAWEVSSIIVVPATREGVLGIARASLAPGGQNVVVALLTPDRIRTADRKLVEQISRTVVLHDVSLEQDPAALLQAAGLKFDPPPGAKFVTGMPGPPAAVYMFGGEPGKTWYVQVARIPLIGERQPVNLVTDCALSIQRQPGLPNPVQTERVENRDIAHIAISPIGEDSHSTAIWASRMDEATACLLVGRHDPGAAETLEEICRAVAVKAGPSGPRMDPVAAIEAGRALLASLKGEQLNKAWSALPALRSYRHRSPALASGRSVDAYETRSADGATWWDIGGQSRLELFPNAEVQLLEHWSIRSDLSAHDHALQRGIERRKILQYEEHRQPGADQVARKVTVLNGGIRSSRAEVDDSYAPEPVLLHAAGQVALGGESAAFAFSTTETFSENSIYWIVTPLGELDLPGGNGKSARAVRLQRDCDPAPILLYYNRAGLLISIAFTDGSWRELETPAGLSS